MKRDSVILNISALGMLIAAIIHFWIIPGHWSHAVVHVFFFLILGALQLVWSLIFLRNPSMILSKWGIYLAGSSIALWVITKFLPSPFGHGLEPITIEGIITKISETSVIVFLVILIRKKASLLQIAKIIMVSASIGIFIYAGAKVVEPLFPGFESPQLHQGHDVRNTNN